MNVNQFIGAGLKDAKVTLADGSIFDIHGIVSVGGDPERDEIEVKGDDTTLGIFTMGMSESISVEANSLTFDVIQAITGNAVSSSSTGAQVPMGTDSEMNPPIVQLDAYTTARSKDGTSGYIQKTWYKVQFTNVRVEQAGENEFKFLADGRAFQTDTDVTGAALTPARISLLRAKSGTIAA